MKKKIIIADDHMLFVSGIKSMLENTDFEIISAVYDGTSLINLLNILETDLVLLDINMPGMNGFETLQLLKKRHPQLKVLIVSMYNDHAFQKRMKQLGAEGYILKDESKETFLKALNLIYSGGSYFNCEKKKCKKDDFILISTLSKREMEVLKYIAKQYTINEIAEKLNLSRFTIETYRENLLRKLKQRNVTGLVLFAYINNIN